MTYEQELGTAAPVARATELSWAESGRTAPGAASPITTTTAGRACAGLRLLLGAVDVINSGISGLAGQVAKGTSGPAALSAGPRVKQRDRRAGSLAMRYFGPDILTVDDERRREPDPVPGEETDIVVFLAPG